MKSGLCDISPGILLRLALDGEALSELQCQILDIDDPDSFWYEKQGTSAFLNIVSEDDLAGAEEIERSADHDFVEDLSYLDFVYTGNLTPSPHAGDGSAGSSNPDIIEADSILGETRLIVSRGGLADQTVIVSSDVSNTFESNPPSLPRSDDFSFETVEDMSRLEQYLGQKLSLLMARCTLEESAEEVKIATIGQLWSLSRRRLSVGVSRREVDVILRAVCDRVCYQKRGEITTHADGQAQPMEEKEAGSSVGNISPLRGIRSEMSDLEKSVIVRRFVQYKPLHQVSRELGLNSYVVKELCERARKEVMASLDATTTQDILSEVWREFVTGTRNAAMPEKTPTTLSERKKRLLRVQDCLFWLGLGALVTALGALVGRGEVVLLTAALVTAYAIVAILTPSPLDDAKKDAGSGKFRPSLGL